MAEIFLYAFLLIAGVLLVLALMPAVLAMGMIATIAIGDWLMAIGTRRIQKDIEKRRKERSAGFVAEMLTGGQQTTPPNGFRKPAPPPAPPR